MPELDFLEKLPSGKNDQKWSKIEYGFFKKITSLVLSGIGVKQKFFWFIIKFCKNCMPACMAHAHNSGSALRIFTIKGVNM